MLFSEHDILGSVYCLTDTKSLGLQERYPSSWSAVLNQQWMGIGRQITQPFACDISEVFYTGSQSSPMGLSSSFPKESLASP